MNWGSLFRPRTLLIVALLVMLTGLGAIVGVGMLRPPATAPQAAVGAIPAPIPPAAPPPPVASAPPPPAPAAPPPVAASPPPPATRIVVQAPPPAPAASPDAPFGPGLKLPIDCRLGDTCWVMNYFDVDSSSATHDFQGHARSYDGHDGVDIAIRDEIEMQRGVNVLASAAGVVIGMRDGEADGAFIALGPTATVDKHCGNGVTLDHGAGWQTQYCHMRRGSVAVKIAERVTAGQILGLVGLSGDAEYPHVHLTVRRNDRQLDPFTGNPAGPCCSNRPSPHPLWDSAAKIEYENIEVFSAGFTAQKNPTLAVLRKNARGESSFNRETPTVTFFAAIWGVDVGDRVRLQIFDRSGAQIAVDNLVARKADGYIVLPRSLSPSPPVWPAGRYRGVATVERDLAGGLWRRTREAQFEIK